MRAEGQNTIAASPGNFSLFRAHLEAGRQRQALGDTVRKLGTPNPYDFGDYNPYQPGTPEYHSADTNACFSSQPSLLQGSTQEAPVLAEAWKAVPSAESPLDNHPLRKRLAAFAGKVANLLMRQRQPDEPSMVTLKSKQL